MPTYRTNALYQAPTVDNAVYEQFGMQPGMDRLNLLPRHDAKLGWIAPNALYQIARALVSPSVAAQGGYVSPEDGVNFAGNVSLGSLGTSALMKRPAPGPGRTVAQTVYHGSPHNFDKFDMSKIGTGEGAQAYGHGLYVAESPAVAKQYQAALSSENIVANGRTYTPDDLRKLPDAQRAAISAGSAQGIEKNLARAKEMLDEGADPKWVADFVRYTKELAANPLHRESAGRLYHVDLPDQHIANMLDWDKPLSQQPANVREAFKRRITEPKAIDGMDMGGNARLRDNRNRQADPTQVQPWILETQSANGTSRFGLSQKDVDRLIGGQDVSQLTGAQIYQRMAAEHGGFPQASEMLKNLGIPGIRYLDGGSRGAGAGTSNYVVFDDKLLKVLKKE